MTGSAIRYFYGSADFVTVSLAMFEADTRLVARNDNRAFCYL